MTADQREQALAALDRIQSDAGSYAAENLRHFEAVEADVALVRAALTPSPLPADLAEIQARADAATPGPWHADAGEDDSDLMPHFGPDGELHIVHGSGWDDDAVFIAHARTDVPALVAELAELRARPTLTVQSYAEAELLPAGSVIRTANGMVCKKDLLGFWGSTTPPELSRSGPRYPAFVLYRPDTDNHEGATS